MRRREFEKIIEWEEENGLERNEERVTKRIGREALKRPQIT